MRLISDAIGEALGLEEETRIPGSTRDSQRSAGSVDAEDAELGDFEEEEIVLIGREEQLAQLEELKQQFLETRQPQVVWITGLSGEGKTSLAEKFLQPVRRDEQILVLAGRCSTESRFHTRQLTASSHLWSRSSDDVLPTS